MHMRKYFLTAFVLAAMLVFTTSGLALEKSVARMTDDTRGDWNAGTTCSVAYYNTCQGWVWVWSGWSPNDRLGVCFENCCLPNHGFVMSNWTYVWTAAPGGYGYTGTVATFDADANCCPVEPPLEAQAFLPVSGWNQYLWNSKISGDRFVVAATVGPASGNPTVFPTDHPAAGPTGSAACGTCYPLDRNPYTYYYGTSISPLCPGSPLNDGVCDAALFFDAQMSCVVSVEEASWGSIKNLYR
jgi:hypothetical protein